MTSPTARSMRRLLVHSQIRRSPIVDILGCEGLIKIPNQDSLRKRNKALFLMPAMVKSTPSHLRFIA